jgi:hypothetical protein
MTTGSPLAQLHALRRRFDDAAQRWSHFPVYRATEDDGEVSISVPDDIPRDALRELQSLAGHAEALLKEVGVTLPGPRRKGAAGRWLAWVFRETRPEAVGEWVDAPVSAANPAEFDVLGDNAFRTSALALDLFLAVTEKAAGSADPAPRTDPPLVPPKPTREEKDAAVRAFLRENPGATVDRVKEATGFSKGTIHSLPAWAKEMQRRSEARDTRSSQPHRERVQLTDERAAMTPSRDDDPALIAEENEERQRKEAAGQDIRISLTDEDKNTTWQWLLAKASAPGRRALEALDPPQRDEHIAYAWEQMQEEREQNTRRRRRRRSKRDS